MFGFGLCDFASFLQFEHAFVEAYAKILCNNYYYNIDSNCATSQAALNMLAKLGPHHLTKYMFLPIFQDGYRFSDPPNSVRPKY